MKINLPTDVENIIQTLETAGFEAYAVGGCVRDTLLGRAPKDWDVTTSAKPEEVKSLFSHTIDTGIEHGTVTVMCNHVGYEVTTYRIDGEYEDARHPKEVTFTSNLAEDLRRRDFTINAMAYSPNAGLVDLFEGAEDLENHVIRCVGNAHERFSEDALRMLRAIRFSAQLGFEIQDETCDAIRDLADTIQKISAERIATELIKTIMSDHPQDFRKAYELGLTKYILPEFDAMMNTPQVSKHHMYNVGEHTLASLDYIEAQKVLRLAMLLHDVAKPLCISIDEEGQNHFYGHPQKGAEMAVKILRRLKLDNDTIKKVKTLVYYHDERKPATPIHMRRMMNEIGVEMLPSLFAVKYADVMAQSDYRKDEKLAYIESLRAEYQGCLDRGECVSLKNLAVNGADLLEIGVSQGKQVGEMLKYLLEIVLEQPEKNTREELLQVAQKQKASKSI